MKITQQQAIAALTDMLEAVQNTKSYKTGFGYGFHRWILSAELKPGTAKVVKPKT